MIEKYGVESVRGAQEDALLIARSRLATLDGVLEKTASEATEATALTEEIAQLEASIAAQ